MKRADQYITWLRSKNFPGHYAITFYRDGYPVVSTNGSFEQTDCPKGWVCPEKKLYDSKIGTWYSLWFDQADLSDVHWKKSLHRPVLGYYRSTDEAIYAQHLRWLKQIGTDFLIIDDTNTVMGLNDNLQNFAAYNTRSPNMIPMALAIGGCLWTASLNTNEERDICQQQEADYTIQNFVTGPFASSYFHWKGKPLLVNTNNYTDPNVYRPDWSDDRFSVRSGSQQGASYTVPAPPDQGGWWGWVFEFPQYVLNASTRYESVGVSPGADNTSNGGSFIVNHESGAYFMKSWVRAIKSNPETIVLTAFNDSGDGNFIEPSTKRRDIPNAAELWTDVDGAESPYLFLYLATAYANLRIGLQEGVSFRDEDSSQVFKVSGGRLFLASEVKGMPAVLLPAGTIKKMLGGANPFVDVPADGTLITSEGLASGVMMNGELLRFESEEVARLFARGEQALSRQAYDLLPYGGLIKKGSDVVTTPGYPPMFVSDRGDAFPTNCLMAIGRNRSPNRRMLRAHYGQYRNRGSLTCP